MDVTVTEVVGDPPRALVTVSSIPAGADRITVSRRAGRRLRRAPRMSRQVAGASVSVVDYEVPLGVPVSYDVTALAANGGVLASTTSSQLVMADPPDGCAWISDPLDELSPLLVQCLVGTDDVRTYPASGEVVSAMSGARYGSMGTRPGLSVWPMTLWAEGADDTRRLRSLLVGANDEDRGGPAGLLVRVAGWHQLPPLLYGIGLSPDEEFSPHRDHTWARWQVELSVTDGPALATVIRRWTCADLLAFGLAEGLTWGTISTVFPTVDALALGPEYL